jgi:hypothetical protein
MTKQVIWKFPVQADTFELELPASACVLTVQLQAGQPFMWVQLDPTAPRHPRRFYTRPTGLEWDETCAGLYRGTFQPVNGLVFHLYEDA